MNLEEQIISVVQKNLEKPHEVTLENKLVEDLGVDSFNKIMIIAAMEDEFSLNIDEQDFKDIVTVKDIVNKMREKFPEL